MKKVKTKSKHPCFLILNFNKNVFLNKQPLKTTGYRGNQTNPQQQRLLTYYELCQNIS